MTFIQGNLSHSSTGDNVPVSRIVLHGTVSPCVRGGARSVASYFQSSSAGGLAHYIVDPGEIVQCAGDNLIVWHAPPNKGSIGVELTDPQDATGPRRWFDPAHTAMLEQAAGLVARLCVKHDLPDTYVDRTAMLAGARGITTHNEVSQAWRQSDHSDPGPGFPIAHFIDLVRSHRTPAVVPVPPKPTPAPALIPSTPSGDRMLVLITSDPHLWEVTGSKLVHINAEAWAARSVLRKHNGLPPEQILHVNPHDPIALLPKVTA